MITRVPLAAIRKVRVVLSTNPRQQYLHAPRQLHSDNQRGILAYAVFRDRLHQTRRNCTATQREGSSEHPVLNTMPSHFPVMPSRSHEKNNFHRKDNPGGLLSLDTREHLSHAMV